MMTTATLTAPATPVSPQTEAPADATTPRPWALLAINLGLRTKPADPLPADRPGFPGDNEKDVCEVRLLGLPRPGKIEDYLEDLIGARLREAVLTEVKGAPELRRFCGLYSQVPPIEDRIAACDEEIEALTKQRAAREQGDGPGLGAELVSIDERISQATARRRRASAELNALSPIVSAARAKAVAIIRATKEAAIPKLVPLVHERHERARAAVQAALLKVGPLLADLHTAELTAEGAAGVDGRRRLSSLGDDLLDLAVAVEEEQAAAARIDAPPAIASEGQPDAPPPMPGIVETLEAIRKAVAPNDAPADRVPALESIQGIAASVAHTATVEALAAKTEVLADLSADVGAARASAGQSGAEAVELQPVEAAPSPRGRKGKVVAG